MSFQVSANPHKINLYAGTAAVPTLTFLSQPTMGFYRLGTNIIGYSVSGGSTSLQFGSGGTIYGAQGNNSLALDASGGITLTGSGTNQSITLTPSGTGGVVAGPSSLTTAVRIGAVSDATTYGIVSFNGSMSSTGALGFSAGGGADKDLYIKVVTGGQFRARINNVDKLLLATTGNLLLGGLTTDGTGVLQLPAATTSAGGITFGTDTSFYRIAAGQMALDHVGGAAPILYFKEAGTNKFAVYSSSGQGVLETVTGQSILLRTNSATALTLDASQNATLVGNLTMTALKQVKFGAIANATIGVSADTTAGVLTFTSPSGGTFSFSGGAADFSNNISANDLRAASGSTIYWNGRSGMTSSGNGTVTFSTSGAALTIASFVNTTGALAFTGGAGNMTITSGTGNSRTMALQTTTSGGVATTFLSANDTQDATFVGYVNGSKVLVSAKTQAVSPYTVSATTDNRVVFTNEAATSLVTFNLPTAAANLDYSFVVQDTDGIRVVASTGDTIRLAGSVSASAGRIDSTTIGSTVRLVAINATEWIATAINGTWTVT